MEWILTILGWFNPIKFIDYLRKPKLEIYYDKKETYIKANDISFQGIIVNFGHVMVRNIGKTTAKNCIGRLKSIEIFKDNKFQAVTEYRNVMDLKWAHEEDFHPKDIEPNEPVRLDLRYAYDGFYILHFFTKKYPSGNQTDFSPGHYRVKVKIVCDNANSIEKYFSVTLNNGDFNSLKIDYI